MYTPDKWIILKIKGEQDNPVYKVLAGWNGGYLDGSSWKINSGITKITEDEQHYYFEGYSGSTYKCHKKCYGTNSLSQSILSKIQSDKNTKDSIEALPDQNFIKLLETTNEE